MYVFSVPAAEKLDEQLFFVHNDSAPDEIDGVDKTAEGQRPERLAVKQRKRPLKTDMYLQPISAVEGFPVRKRRVIKRHKQQTNTVEKMNKDDWFCTNATRGGVCAVASADSSSEDDDSASYGEIRRQQLAKLKEQAKWNPPKPVHKTVMKDLWANSESISDTSKESCVFISRSALQHQLNKKLLFLMNIT